MYTKSILLLIILTISCTKKKQISLQKTPSSDTTKTNFQDSIIAEHHTNGALKWGIYTQEWQKEIDKGLEKDSTIAFLWQQKAMPLFKLGKYELGMVYLDKAVQYNSIRYKDYRAFIKCIFMKSYHDAIIDFEECKKEKGNSYVMDHSYNFYIALSKIQLNQFREAEGILEKEIQKEKKDLVHHLDLFYLGIARYELSKYQEAIEVFNWALQLYPQFSDALFLKVIA